MEEVVRAIQTKDAEKVAEAAERHSRILNTVIHLPLHNNYYNVIPGRSAVQDANMRTPITYAIMKGVPDRVLETLLEKGANPNVKDRHTYPLLIAVNHQKESYCRILLAHGADPNVELITRDYDMFETLETPLINAVMRKNRRLVELLMEHGATPKRSMLEDIWNQLRVEDTRANPKHGVQLFETMEPLLGTRFNMNWQNAYGETILHLIAKSFVIPSAVRVPIVQYLMQQGADGTLQDMDGKYAFDLLQAPYDEPAEETQKLYKVLVSPVKKNLYKTIRLGTANVFPYKFYPAAQHQALNTISRNNANRKNRTNRNKNNGNKSRKVPRKTMNQQLRANKPTGYLPQNIARLIANFTY